MSIVVQHHFIGGVVIGEKNEVSVAQFVVA